MKCIVCQSDETFWVGTFMETESKGYERYACNDCKSDSEYGIKVIEFIYTNENNVFPIE